MMFLSRKTSLLRSSLWRRLLVMLVPVTVSYRPERYYMRGPGPKYRERHPGLQLDLAGPRRSE
jgi:hypothetical protein